MEKGNCWALLFLHTGFLDIPVGLVKTIPERQTWRGRKAAWRPNGCSRWQWALCLCGSFNVRRVMDREWNRKDSGITQGSNSVICTATCSSELCFTASDFQGWLLASGPTDVTVISLLCFCRVSVSPSACLSLLQPDGQSIWRSLCAHIPKLGGEKVCVPSFLANSLTLTLITQDQIMCPSRNSHYDQRDEIDCSGYLLLWNKSLQNLGTKTTVISLFSWFLWVRHLGKVSWVTLAWGPLWTCSQIY